MSQTYCDCEKSPGGSWGINFPQKPTVGSVGQCEFCHFPHSPENCTGKVKVIAIPSPLRPLEIPKVKPIEDETKFPPTSEK